MKRPKRYRTVAAFNKAADVPGGIPEAALPKALRRRDFFRECCTARMIYPAGTPAYGCTLPSGHKGWHVAHGSEGQAYAVWEDE